MAIIRNGIFGAVQGKLGSVVGAKWKNTPYLRMLPRKKKKKTPATPAQIACREKFRFVQEWLQPFYPYVTNGYRNFARDKTEINAAFSANYREAVNGMWPSLSIDYEKVSLSKGNLPQLYAVEIERTGPDTLKLSWGRDEQDDSAFDDQVMLVLYSRELKMADGFIGGVKRTDQHCSFKINPKLIGKALDVYVSAISLNGRRVANSTYLGRIDPL